MKVEENEMLPQLKSARLDWRRLAAEMAQRRQQLMPFEKIEAGREEAAGFRHIGAAGQSSTGRGSRGASPGSSIRRI